MKPNKKKKQLDKEMKEQIDNWLNSSVYLSFKKKLDEKKKNLLKNLDIKKAIIQKKYSMMNEEELTQFCKGVIESDNQPDIESDWIEYLNSTKSLQDILNTYNSLLIDCYLYLSDYILKEKYEVACLIKKVIAIEEKQLKKIVVTYYGQTEEYMDEYIRIINDACIEKINKMLDDRK